MTNQTANTTAQQFKVAWGGGPGSVSLAGTLGGATLTVKAVVNNQTLNTDQNLTFQGKIAENTVRNFQLFACDLDFIVENADADTDIEVYYGSASGTGDA